MEFLDDILSDTSAAPAKARGKFQPKAKPRPKKVPAAKATEKQHVTPVTTTDATSTQTLQSSDPTKKLNNPDGSCVATSGEVLTGNHAAVSETFIIDGYPSTPVTTIVDSEIGSATGDARCDFGKSTGRNVEAFLAPDPINDIITQSENVAEEVEHDFQHISSVSFSPHRSSNADADVVSCNEDAVLVKGNFIQPERSKAEGAESLSAMYPHDVMFETITTGTEDGQFRPMPEASKRIDMAESVSHFHEVFPVPSENQYTDEGVSIHTVLHDLASDLPSTTVDNSFSTYHTSECYLNHTSSELLEASQLNDATPASAMVDGGETENLSIPPGEGEFGYEFDVGLGDGIHVNGMEQFCPEVPAEPDADKNLGNDDNLRGEKTGTNRRQTKKSNEFAAENVKLVRKRKKAGEVQENTDKQPPKRFSRSTRRKRTVDKSLLEMPEDEIDFQRLPIRDLIILAELKERNASKEAAAAKPVTTDEGPDSRNTFAGNEGFDSYYGNVGYRSYYGEEGFASDQDRDTYDAPTSSTVRTDADYFNYMSHMNRKPTVRWSKQDTELFYQGVRQFGSDLSMIQQLFPDRTRHQIKLKYKKEERQHPMMLMDALTCGAKDHAQFEHVIERLKAINPEEIELKSDKDDSADMKNEGGNTDEIFVENQEPSQDGAAKSEEVKAGFPDDFDAGEPSDGSPVKSHNSDDGMDFWEQYEGFGA